MQSNQVKSRKKSDGTIEIVDVPDATLEVARRMVAGWRKEDPDGRQIQSVKAQVALRLVSISAKNEEFTPAVLEEAGRDYCRMERRRYKAAHNWLSLVNEPDTEHPPFYEWAVAVVKRHEEAAQANGAGAGAGGNDGSSTAAAPEAEKFVEDGPTLPKSKAWIRGNVARMLREPPPPVRWLVEGLIPAAVPGILAARAGAGKSSTALLVATGLAAGLPVLGRPVGHDARRGVVFAGLEDDESEFHRRLSRAVDLLSEDSQWTDQHRFNLVRNLVPLFPDRASGAAFHLDAQWQALAKMAMAIPDGCGLIVLDTLASMTDGDENKASDMRSFNEAAAALAQSTGAAVLSIHHVGKGNDTPSDKKLWQRLHPEALRGSSAVEAAARFVLQMAALSPSEAVTAGLDGEAALRGAYVALHLSKINSAEKGDTVLLERCHVGEPGAGFLRTRPDSERILAGIQGAAAVMKLTRRDSVLLAIAEAGGLGKLDQNEAAAKTWPDSLNPRGQWNKVLCDLRKAGWLVDQNLTDAGWAQAATKGYSGGMTGPHGNLGTTTDSARNREAE